MWPRIITQDSHQHASAQWHKMHSLSLSIEMDWVSHEQTNTMKWKYTCIYRYWTGRQRVIRIRTEV